MMSFMKRQEGFEEGKRMGGGEEEYLKIAIRFSF
jgi:hypothetical protein